MTVRWFLIAITVCVAAALHSGCTSINSYVQPTAQDVALLSGKSVRNTTFDWESFTLTAVDDKFVPVPFGSSATNRVALTAEPHRLVVQATFNRQFSGSGPFEAFVAVPFEPQSATDYRLGGKVRDNLVEVWVENRITGERVSDVFSAPYQTQPKTPVYTVYAPIYLAPVSSPAVAVSVR